MTETTTARNETTVEADESLPHIRIVREFDASPAAVLRAHVDPEVFVKWNGPHELDTQVRHWDARDGGSWRYVSRAADGTEYGFRGCFHTVDDAGVVVQTFAYDGFPDAVTLELTELPGGRTRLEATSLWPSFEARDGMVASGMEQGVAEGYEQLDEVLAAG